MRYPLFGYPVLVVAAAVGSIRIFRYFVGHRLYDCFLGLGGGLVKLVLDHAHGAQETRLQEVLGLLGFLVEIDHFEMGMGGGRPFLPVGMDPTRQQVVGGSLAAGTQEWRGVLLMSVCA